jgi:hypothetical protein
MVDPTVSREHVIFYARPFSCDFDLTLSGLAENGAQGDALYYVVSPTDIVVARPRDMDDKILWLTDHGKFSEAIEIAEKNSERLRTTKIGRLKRAYMQILIEEKEWAEAALHMPAALADEITGEVNFSLHLFSNHSVMCLQCPLPFSEMLAGQICWIVIKDLRRVHNCLFSFVHQYIKVSHLIKKK